jgi:NitT/TauT family transport system substrate-binding protein
MKSIRRRDSRMITSGFARSAAALFGVVLVAIGAACSNGGGGSVNVNQDGPPASAPAPEEAVGPAKIRAVVLPFLSLSPFYIAAEEGYFEEQNLEVEFVRLPRNVEAIPALARGEVDIGFSQLTIPLLNAMARGLRLKLAAGVTYLLDGGCTGTGIVARRSLVDSGQLRRPEDLVGLKVELDVLLPQAFYIERLLAPVGLGVGDLDAVNLPPQSNFDALINGSIDVTVATEPHVTRMVDSGEAVVWRSAQEVLPDFQVSWLVFGPTLLDERPEIGERFMVAYLKAMRQYELGKTPRNVDILARGTDLSEEVLRGTCWPALRPEARASTEGSTALQEWLVSRELIDRVIPESELVESRFVDHAAKVLEP